MCGGNPNLQIQHFNNLLGLKKYAIIGHCALVLNNLHQNVGGGSYCSGHFFSPKNVSKNNARTRLSSPQNRSKSPSTTSYFPPKKMPMLTTRRHAFSEDDHAFAYPPSFSAISTNSPFPQRREDIGKPTLVLDMDETLLHSVEVKSPLQERCSSTPNSKLSFLVQFPDGTGVRVHPRPFLMEFLLEAKQRYELVVFTAGSEEYANLVLDTFDPTRTLFSHRLFRQHCEYVTNPANSTFGFLKDLHVLQRDMRRTICVDNMIHFVKQMENGIPIPSYFNDPQDFALRNLMFLLRQLEHSLDVRRDLAEMAKMFQHHPLPSSTC